MQARATDADYPVCAKMAVSRHWADRAGFRWDHHRERPEHRERRERRVAFREPRIFEVAGIRAGGRRSEFPALVATSGFQSPAKPMRNLQMLWGKSAKRTA